MNMKIKERFTMNRKVTEHPNARKYPGRPSLEFGTALRKFLGDLEPDEMKQFYEGTLVFEEEYSAEFFDSLEEGDVVGLGLLRGFNEMNMNKHEEPAAYKFKILTINKDNDTIQARNVTWESPKNEDYQGTEVELAFEDVSCALGMGFGEILERDGKPFGVAEEVEQEILLVAPADEEDESDDNAASQSGSDSKEEK